MNVKDKKVIRDFNEKFRPLIFEKLEEIVMIAREINSEIPLEKILSLLDMTISELWLTFLLDRHPSIAQFSLEYIGFKEAYERHRDSFLRYFLSKHEGEEFYKEVMHAITPEKINEK